MILEASLLCTVALAICGAVISFLGLLDGPERRGKSYKWKKDGDPALPKDAGPLLVALDKIQWFILSHFPRKVVPILFPPPNLNFYDVKEFPGVAGKVCITIDDCFVRQSNAACSLVSVVRSILSGLGHKASFFTTLNYSKEDWKQEEIVKVLKDGHELCNHCKDDREYDSESKEVFEKDLDETEEFLKDCYAMMGKEKVGAWFRAPSGKMSKAMEEALAERGMTNVMMDCYGNDPHIPDARFVASCILRAVTDGSIIILHCPEKGFREWEVEILQMVLDGLKKKGLKSVTLSEMKKIALAEKAD
eukprot:CAMPEP_0118641928 /NCGR_PEP_ID=MMETSP0785-20121206/5569_1 /TAXON_ID=91992 /ORGANISM="Bolidomonas pacifica, Strain CCMP 1866" /LENGTH=304 /DNA_ID=CAMNT_0006533457 /DNA_START=9 /DNA_END=923 /DNA_ORIENTATION=+